MVPPLTWKRIELSAGRSFLEFELRDGLIEPGDLPRVGLPDEVAGRSHLGIVFSGRGPVWLYAYLSHLAHPFAWVGIYEPRRQGAVVVQRHRQDAPGLGQVVPTPEVPTPEVPTPEVTPPG